MGLTEEIVTQRMERDIAIVDAKALTGEERDQALWAMGRQEGLAEARQIVLGCHVQPPHPAEPALRATARS
jgi:hypothetical protein